ncbi:MAG: alpha/beta hydrolase [Myxococcales bacterium]|jgi:polyhydroxyalkanoate synthase|nr:alpha/beta hydrolase [Myxococcales bacterium]
MILRTDTVEQTVDRDRRVVLVKDVIMTPGQPLGMVRKRLPPPHESKGTLLLVHGFAQNRYTWHLERRSFSAYLAAEGWDVFQVDLRGHGRSRWFSESRPRTVDEYVQEDIPLVLREALRLSGQERGFLIGHSMGGMIAYAAAAPLREKLRGLVSIGSPFNFGLGNTFLRNLARVLATVRFTGVFDRNPLLPTHLVGRHLLDRLRPALDLPFWPGAVQGWRPGSMEPEVLHEFLGKSFEATSVQILFDIFSGADRVSLARSAGRVDYGVAFEALDLPLLVIAGTADSLAPPDSVKEAYLKSGSTDKTYREFPAGHIDLVLGREAPTTVWPLVRDWLARH